MNCSKHRKVISSCNGASYIFCYFKSSGFSVPNTFYQCNKVYDALYTKMGGFHLITDDSLKFILQPVKLTTAFKVPSSVSSLLPAQSCPQCNFVVKDNLYVALSILF